MRTDLTASDDAGQTECYCKSKFLVCIFASTPDTYSLINPFRSDGFRRFLLGIVFGLCMTVDLAAGGTSAAMAAMAAQDRDLVHVSASDPLEALTIPAAADIRDVRATIIAGLAAAHAPDESASRRDRSRFEFLSDFRGPPGAHLDRRCDYARRAGKRRGPGLHDGACRQGIELHPTQQGRDLVRRRTLPIHRRHVAGGDSLIRSQAWLRRGSCRHRYGRRPAHGDR